MKRKMTKGQVINLIQNRKDGFTNKQIASRLGVHPETINYWFKRLRDDGYEVPTRVFKGGRKKMNL